MIDRELLELAAKAAGIELLDWRDQWADYNGPAWRTTERELWNPLTDDGDALRMAVKLRLPIRDALNGTVETGNERSGRPIWEFYGDDDCAATRRAIVRAAASIGEQLCHT